jgi:hypothetical protein
MGYALFTKSFEIAEAKNVGSLNFAFGIHLLYIHSAVTFYVKCQFHILLNEAAFLPRYLCVTISCLLQADPANFMRNIVCIL